MLNNETTNHSSENLSNSSQPDSKNAVRTVRDLLGPSAVLLPVTKGEKRPAITDWQNTTVKRMDDPDYLAQLESSNIGVLLGSGSDDICAIDIDADDAVEPFLELNPLLRGTLRTRGARGAQIWIKVADEYPKLTKIKTSEGADFGEWRADGGQSVIHGIHPSGVSYQITHRAQPLEIRFSEIVWPADLKLPWVKTDFDAVVEEAFFVVSNPRAGGLPENGIVSKGTMSGCNSGRKKLATTISIVSIETLKRPCEELPHWKRK